MWVLADSLFDLIYEHALEAVVNAAVLGALGGLVAWLTASYRRFCSIDNQCKKLTELMKSALLRLDKHEQRLDQHDIMLAEIRGKESA